MSRLCYVRVWREWPRWICDVHERPWSLYLHTESSQARITSRHEDFSPVVLGVDQQEGKREIERERVERVNQVQRTVGYTGESRGNGLAGDVTGLPGMALRLDEPDGSAIRRQSLIAASFTSPSLPRQRVRGLALPTRFRVIPAPP